MIGGGRVLAGEDHVVKVRGTGRVAATVLLDPGRESRNLERFDGVEPPTMRQRRASLRIVGKGSAGAGIVRRGAVWCFQSSSNIGASAETGIDQPLRAQLFEGLAISGSAQRLNQHRLVPV